MSEKHRRSAALYKMFVGVLSRTNSPSSHADEGGFLWGGGGGGGMVIECDAPIHASRLTLESPTRLCLGLAASCHFLSRCSTAPRKRRQIGV